MPLWKKLCLPSTQSPMLRACIKIVAVFSAMMYLLHGSLYSHWQIIFTSVCLALRVRLTLFRSTFAYRFYSIFVCNFVIIWECLCMFFLSMFQYLSMSVSVWPDAVFKKNSQMFLKLPLEYPQQFLRLLIFFKIAQKSTNFLGYFCKQICCQEVSKIAHLVTLVYFCICSLLSLSSSRSVPGTIPLNRIGSEMCIERRKQKTLKIIDDTNASNFHQNISVAKCLVIKSLF